MARILVVEDERAVRSMICQALRSGGHDVSEASHGLMAMKILKGAPVDLVITDIFMPVQDGLQTIRELRKDHPDTKIIAISGPEWTDSYDVLFLASKLGADRVLRKPFTGAQLQATVAECLEPESAGRSS